jgi:hypothetical protein
MAFLFLLVDTTRLLTVIPVQNRLGDPPPPKTQCDPRPYSYRYRYLGEGKNKHTYRTRISDIVNNILIHFIAKLKSAMLTVLYYVQLILVVAHQAIDLVGSLMNMNSESYEHTAPSGESNGGTAYWLLHLIPLVGFWGVFASNTLYVVTRTRTRNKKNNYQTPEELADLFEEYLPSNESSSLDSEQMVGHKTSNEKSQHGESCPICLEGYLDQNSDVTTSSTSSSSCCSSGDGQPASAQRRLVKTRECGHLFHEKCIMVWCQHQVESRSDVVVNNTGNLILTCPCCRCPLDAQDKNISTIRSRQQGEDIEEDLEESASRSWYRRAMPRTPLLADGRASSMAKSALWVGVLTAVAWNLINGGVQRHQRFYNYS